MYKVIEIWLHSFLVLSYGLLKKKEDQPSSFKLKVYWRKAPIIFFSRRCHPAADCQVVYVGLMERTHDKCAALVRSDCTLETLLSDNYAVNCTPECRPNRSSARKTHRVDLSASSDAL